MTRYLAIASLLALAACSTPPAPIVDLEGVDVRQYQRDLAECYQNPPAFTFGNHVTQCMTKKGYKVLEGFQA